jgi:hypothetical protein
VGLSCRAWDAAAAACSKSHAGVDGRARRRETGAAVPVAHARYDGAVAAVADAATRVEGRAKWAIFWYTMGERRSAVASDDENSIAQQARMAELADAPDLGTRLERFISHCYIGKLVSDDEQIAN